MTQRWFDINNNSHDFPDEWIKNDDPKWKDEYLVPLSMARRIMYPSIGDQLDALFHAGMFPADMAAKIQAVKDKYPK
jgi:hypothetical protein